MKFYFVRFYGRIAVCPDSHDAFTLEAIQRNVEGLGSMFCYHHFLQIFIQV